MGKKGGDRVIGALAVDIDAANAREETLRWRLAAGLGKWKGAPCCAKENGAYEFGEGRRAGCHEDICTF